MLLMLGAADHYVHLEVEEVVESAVEVHLLSLCDHLDLK